MLFYVGEDGAVIHYDMKRLLFILMLLILVGCAAPRVMRFVERGVFVESQLDSVLVANSLPSLELWRSSHHVTMKRTLFTQYTFVRSLYQRGSSEAVFTVEDRDSVFLFVHREIVDK